MGSSGRFPAQFLDRAALAQVAPLQAGTALGGNAHAKKAGVHEKTAAHAQAQKIAARSDKCRGTENARRDRDGASGQERQLTAAGQASH
jgi:hypothetical protein